MSLKEVAMPVGHNVLMVIDLYFLIVGDPQGILDQQLKTHPILSLNIIIMLNNYIIIYYLIFGFKKDHPNQSFVTLCLAAINRYY
jgi:hypothetical protein